MLKTADVNRSRVSYRWNCVLLFLAVVVFLPSFEVLSASNKPERTSSIWKSAVCFSSVTPIDLLNATADLKLRMNSRERTFKDKIRVETPLKTSLL